MQAGQNPEQVSVAQAYAFIKNKKDLYRACLANQYFLPDIKDPLCTVAFLQKVRDGTVLSFKLNTIKRHICAYPPTKQEVHAQLKKVL